MRCLYKMMMMVLPLHLHVNSQSVGFVFRRKLSIVGFHYLGIPVAWSHEGLILHISISDCEVDNRLGMVGAAETSIHLGFVVESVFTGYQLPSTSGLDTSSAGWPEADGESTSILSELGHARTDPRKNHSLMLENHCVVISLRLDCNFLLELSFDVNHRCCTQRIVHFANHVGYLTRHIVILLEVCAHIGGAFVDTTTTLNFESIGALLCPSGENLFLVDNKVLGAQDVCLDL